MPKYILINCVWRNELPEIKEIVDFLFLLSIEEDLNRLFICQNTTRNSNTIYNLLGIILYSYTLCHYTVLIFNKEQHLFTLYNDDTVKEFKTLYDFFSELLIDNVNLYDNDKAYFYPVMLIYTKNTIYNTNDNVVNMLDEKKYLELLNNLEINQNNYIKRHTLTEEQKKKNFDELIEKQKIYNNQVMNKNINAINNTNNINNNNSTNNRNNINSINNEDNKKNIDINVDIDNNNNSNENKKNENDWMNYNFEDDDKKRNQNRINNLNNNNNININNTSFINDNNSKIYGNDLLYGKTNKNDQGTDYYNYYKQLNNVNIDDLVIKNNETKNNNIQNEYLRNIHEQSNYSMSDKNDLINSQRINMINDFGEIDDNRLAQSQIIQDPRNMFNINNNNNNKNNLNRKSNRINDKVNSFQSQNKGPADNKRNKRKNENKLSSSQYINLNNNYTINNSQNEIKDNNLNMAQSQYNINVPRNLDNFNFPQNQMNNKRRNNNNNLAQSQYNINTPRNLNNFNLSQNQINTEKGNNNINLAQSQYNIRRNTGGPNLSQSQLDLGRNNNSSLAQSHYNLGRTNKK